MKFICFSICICAILPFITTAVEKVNLAVYYESLCPASSAFFHNQLDPTFGILSSYLNVDLIPYGNANYSGNPGAYTFSCQHGKEECYGNTMQACYINLVNSSADQIKFVNCAFYIHTQQNVLDKCIEDKNLRGQVKICLDGPKGNRLSYLMAKKTNDLKPKHEFVPWITINGKGSEDISYKAMEDLKNTICDEFKNEKPDVCIKIEQNPLNQLKNNFI